MSHRLGLGLLLCIELAGCVGVERPENADLCTIPDNLQGVSEHGVLPEISSHWIVWNRETYEGGTYQSDVLAIERSNGQLREVAVGLDVQTGAYLSGDRVLYRVKSGPNVSIRVNDLERLQESVLPLPDGDWAGRGFAGTWALLDGRGGLAAPGLYAYNLRSSELRPLADAYNGRADLDGHHAVWMSGTLADGSLQLAVHSLDTNTTDRHHLGLPSVDPVVQAGVVVFSEATSMDPTSARIHLTAMDIASGSRSKATPEGDPVAAQQPALDAGRLAYTEMSLQSGTSSVVVRDLVSGRELYRSSYPALHPHLDRTAVVYENGLGIQAACIP